MGAGGVPASEQMRAAGNQTEMRPELGGRSSSAAAAELGIWAHTLSGTRGGKAGSQTKSRFRATFKKGHC